MAVAKGLKPTIKKAVKFLANHEWIRGQRYDGLGGHCILGAIEATVGIFPDDEALCYQVIKALATEIRKIFPDGRVLNPFNLTNVSRDGEDTLVIAAWNDMLCRSKEDAVEMLKRAGGIR